MKVRASLGTLVKLGLIRAEQLDEPTTAYFLQYSPNGCLAGCMFCAQSRAQDGSKDVLGRITWPAVELSEILGKWREGLFERVCFQTVLKQDFFSETVEFVREMRSLTNVPLSVAITPVPRSALRSLADLGVDKIGVGLDTATEELFTEWGKPYTWGAYWKFVEEAVEVFGKGNVYVHLIVGLGERPRDLLSTAKKVYSLGAEVALFNYVEPKSRRSVDLRYYRIAQIAVELLRKGTDPGDYIDFDALVLRKMPDIDVYSALFTKGCPGCNRPFYTDFPAYPIYNFSSRKLLEAYRRVVEGELKSIGANI